MADGIGRTRWAIAEGFLPERVHGLGRELESHEAACVLNANDAEAHVAITIFFTDRDPAGPYRLTVPARRTVHLRFDDLRDPEPIPRAREYASVLESDVPIIVQHTRLDARRGGTALISTIAYAAE